MNPILCICISTYNRGRKIELLVKEILKFQSDKIEVVVLDDNSSDDTIERISLIEDARLHILKNSENKGAKKNWFETINCGYGKYILHLLDRDWIHIEYLKKIIDILEAENFGFGYIGDMYNFVGPKISAIEKYSKGEEALKKFAFTLIHPSGFLVKKSAWDTIKNKADFFVKDEYGVYPHSYIYALLATEYNGILIQYPMIEITNMANYAKYRSKFYHSNMKNTAYWWTPEAHKMELEGLTYYAYKNMNLSLNILQKILEYRFYENLYAATVLYRKHAKNPINTKHYEIKAVYVKESTLIRINWGLVLGYLKFLNLNCRKLVKLDFFLKLIEMGIKNMNNILSYR